MNPRLNSRTAIIVTLVAVICGFVGGIVGGITTYQRDLLRGENLPLMSSSVNSVLGIPVVVYHPNNALLKAYSPTWEGLQVKYVGNIFPGLNQDMLYIPEERDGKVLLPWYASENGSPGLRWLDPGSKLTLLDNKIYDLGLGPLFVKARLEEVFVGYVPLNILIGETEVVGNELWAAEKPKRLISSTTVTYDGIRLYAVELPSDDEQIAKEVELLGDPTRYTELSAGQSGSHPLFAASTLLAVLFFAAQEKTSDVDRQEILEASDVFFNDYVIPRQVVHADGSVSWPYEFEWITNWGVKLTSPWYSAYPTAAFANAAALMFRMTGEEQYRHIAENAMRYIGTAVERGGGEYSASQFKLPAEYIYDFSHTPNIRVLDGELITVVYSYNTARLLGNEDILDISTRQAMSLAMQLPLFQNADGSLSFAMYVEEMPDGYTWSVWSALQALSNIIKDRRFLDAAQRMEPHIPAELRELKGY